MARKLERPSEDLPPDEAVKAWDKYLDAELGSPVGRPKHEILVPPRQLANNPDPGGKVVRTPKSELYIKALKNVLPKLPTLQQLIIGQAYGIQRPESITQEQIAENVGLPQSTVNIRLQIAEKSIKRLVRKEMARLVKEEIRKSSKH